MLPEGKPSQSAAKERYDFADYICDNTTKQMTKK
jgi:hypothetical protein